MSPSVYRASTPPCMTSKLACALGCCISQTLPWLSDNQAAAADASCSTRSYSAAMLCTAGSPQLPVARTLNGLLGGLETQTHILVPAQTTLAGDLVCCLLGPGRHTSRLLVSQGLQVLGMCDQEPGIGLAAAPVHAWGNLSFICGLLVLPAAAHPRFTPSCFWNALSVCRHNVTGQQRPEEQQPAHR